MPIQRSKREGQGFHTHPGPKVFKNNFPQFSSSKTMPISESKFRPSYTFQSKGLSVDFVAAFLVESTTKEHLKNGSISAHKLCKTVRLCEFQGLTMPKVLLDTRLKCQICIVTDLKGLPSRANPGNPPLQELLCNFLRDPDQTLFGTC